MNFEELLRENGVEIAPEGHEHTSAGFLNFDCPWCSKGWKHWRMGYNTSFHYVNCWACGRHGLTETLMELLDIGWRQANKLLTQVEIDPQEKIKIPRGRLVLPKGLCPLLPPQQRYLQKRRGFNWRKLVRLWEIQAIPLASRLSWRIFIPIFFKGEMVSWTTRSISDKHSERYVSASPQEESMSHKELLYGEDYVRDTILVLEGPTDVWRVGPGSTCTFGTTFSTAQVERISRYPRRGVCFDREPFAQKRAEELCDLLSPFRGETFNIKLETGKDPGNADIKEIRKLRSLFLGLTPPQNSIQSTTDEEGR